MARPADEASPADKSVVRLRSEYGRSATDEVLAATSLEDLSERLDALAVDSDLFDQEINPDVKVDWKAFRTAVSQPLDTPSLTRALGITAAQRCERGWKAFQSAMPILERLKDRFDKLFPDRPTARQAARPSQLVDYAYDLSLAPAFRQVIGMTLRALAATYVIARAEERDQRLEPWLALGLADFWAEGPERLASALFDTDRVIAIISHFNKAERLDRVVEEWKLAAAASGEGIYCPFDQPDDYVDEGSQAR
jgi:hypothetical protein